MKAITTNRTDAHRLCAGRVLAAVPLLIALWLHPNHSGAQTTISSNASPVITNVAGGGFENPLLPVNTFLPNPAAPGWAFGGTHAGFSRNGSGFTSGNPAAPEGQQVLYLQISGSAATTINFPATGYYRFSCKAARRANHGGVQTFRLSIDNNTFDTIKPADNNYLLYKTTAVYITAGNHELKLTGNTIPTTGDNTAFVDDLKMERLASWSNAASWTGGVVPATTSHRAVIDPNETVVLDVNTTVKSIDISGQLIAAKDLKNLNLTADWIMVNGGLALMDWGTATAPFTGNATITLTGVNTGTPVNGWGVGEKFLGARQGGVIEMHGTNKTSWTQLNATAAAGATSVILKDPVNWNVGDQFVIASTDFNPAQAEVRTVTSKSADNRTIFFSGVLSYTHYGLTQSYSGGTYILDERAEVGLLTRNIRIVGANPGAAGFGGHCMFVENAKVRFSGVEFYNMGQKGIKGRYPFHWHELGNVSGQYIKNSSINVSFNRAVAVHTSQNALIEDNVAYDHIGHGFYLEDEGSTRNIFKRNLGLLTRKPSGVQAIVPTDSIPGINGLFNTPATFWVNHPDNDLIENAAAGSEGSGIWFLGKNNMRMGAVNDNRAHSNTFNFTVDGNVDPIDDSLTYGHFRPLAGTTPYINRFTSFKARERGLWTRGDSMVFNDCRLADCPRNDFFAYNQQLRNSLIVGKSGNTGTSSTFTTNESAAGRSLALPGLPATNEFNIFYGHSIYDGPSGAKNVHFAGFNGNNAFAFSIFPAAQKSPLHWAESISFEAGMADTNKIQFRKSTDAEMMYASGLVDRNGSITGITGAVIMPRILPNPNGSTKIHENGFNRRPNATLNNTWNAYINPTGGPFRLLRVDEHTKNTSGYYTTHPQYNIRSDGPATYGWPTDFAGNAVPSWHQNPVIVNDNAYKYFWQRHKIPNRAEAVLRFGNTNDYVISVFPNMPSYTYVYGGITTSGGNNSGTALPRVNTLALLESSTQQAYYLANNTLYVKHISNIAGYGEENVPFGHDKRSNPINICLLPNCGTTTNQTGELAEAVFADMEQQGGDSRCVISKTGALTLPTLSFDATTAGSATDGVNNKASWTITKVNDAVDDYVEVRINIPRQIWWDFNHIRFNLTGASFEVLVNDANQNLRSLGSFAGGVNATTPVNVPLNVASNSGWLDNVTALIIRVKESQITGASATMNLFNISLSVNNPGSAAPPAAMPVSESAPAAVKRLQVYPNPASRQVTLSNHFSQADIITVDVLNTLGRSVYTEKQRVNEGVWNYRMPLPRLPQGAYMLRITGSGGSAQSVPLHIAY